jgi:hypothetical protein
VSGWYVLVVFALGFAVGAFGRFVDRWSSSQTRHKWGPWRVADGWIYSRRCQRCSRFEGQPNTQWYPVEEAPRNVWLLGLFTNGARRWWSPLAVGEDGNATATLLLTVGEEDPVLDESEALPAEAHLVGWTLPPTLVSAEDPDRLRDEEARQANCTDPEAEAPWLRPVS